MWTSVENFKKNYKTIFCYLNLVRPIYDNDRSDENVEIWTKILVWLKGEYDERGWRALTSSMRRRWKVMASNLSAIPFIALWPLIYHHIYSPTVYHFSLFIILIFKTVDFFLQFHINVWPNYQFNSPTLTLYWFCTIIPFLKKYA